MPKSQPFQAPELRSSDIYKSPTLLLTPKFHVVFLLLEIVGEKKTTLFNIFLPFTVFYSVFCPCLPHTQHLANAWKHNHMRYVNSLLFLFLSSGIPSLIPPFLDTLVVFQCPHPLKKKSIFHSYSQ